jgi:hypothetical protein
VAHPFFDIVAYPWHRTDARELHAVLTMAITVPASIDLLYKGSSAEVLPLNQNQAPNLIWKEALENLAVAGALQALCNLVLAQAGRNKSLRKALEDVINAVPAVEVQFVPDSVSVLDRVELRNSLTNLESDASPVRVLLVRGGPKTGKSQGKFLFERAAKDSGAKVVYLFEGIVATVDDVVKQLFGALEATSEIPDPRSTTREAWYQAVCVQLQEVAARKKQRMWIAVDDLGPGPGDPPAPLLDREIREFCEQFALNMPNPLFAEWFRLMLIHYPEGDVPTRWRHEFWSEDRTSEADVQQTHVEEFLRSWAVHRDRKLLDDEVTSLAASIIATVDGPQPAAHNKVPRLKRLHDTVEQTLRDLERRSP